MAPVDSSSETRDVTKGAAASLDDQRTDEFVQRTEESFREIRAEIRNLRGKIDRRSDITLGAMLTGFVGLIVTHFIG